MRNITVWLNQQAKRSERFISIADLLFAGKSIRYIYFRLRYFNWLVLIRLAFHLVVFYVLQEALLPANFSQLGGLWALGLIIYSAWWGGLEVLRTQVRDYYSTKNTTAINQTVSNWLSLGFIGAGICLLASLLFLSLAILHWQQSQASFSYFLASSILFSLAGRLALEPYHSGIYAISRVLRPMSSLVLGELVGFVIVLSGWHWLHKAVLPLAILVAGTVNTLLRYYYCRKMYRFYQLQLSLGNAKPLTVARQALSKDFVLAALAMLMINFEGPVLITAAGLNSNQPLFHQLFTVLFLTLPLVNASSEWAQLFYFDWKKLRRFNFTALRLRFNQAILVLSPFIGLSLGLVALLIGQLITPAMPWAVYGMVFLLLVIRAVIAYLQIRAFTHFYYLDVIISGILLLSMPILSYQSFTNPWLCLGCFLLVSVVCISYLLRQRLPATENLSQFKQQVTFYDWLYQLRITSGRVQLGKLMVDPNTSYYKCLRIVQWLSKTYLQPGDLICVRGQAIIFYQANPEQQNKLDVASLAINTGGLVQSYQLSPLFTKNAPHFSVELKSYLLEHIVQQPSMHSLTEPISEQFLLQFPEGVEFIPHCSLGSKASLLARENIHGLLYRAEQFLNDQPADNFPYEVAVRYENGTVTTIYATPKLSYSHKLLRAWRKELDKVNIVGILQ